MVSVWYPPYAFQQQQLSAHWGEHHRFELKVLTVGNKKIPIKCYYHAQEYIPDRTEVGAFFCNNNVVCLKWEQIHMMFSFSTIYLATSRREHVCHWSSSMKSVNSRYTRDRARGVLLWCVQHRVWVIISQTEERVWKWLVRHDWNIITELTSLDRLGHVLQWTKQTDKMLIA